jgi:hypothetical protein
VILSIISLLGRAWAHGFPAARHSGEGPGFQHRSWSSNVLPSLVIPAKAGLPTAKLVIHLALERLSRTELPLALGERVTFSSTAKRK